MDESHSTKERKASGGGAAQRKKRGKKTVLSDMTEGSEKEPSAFQMIAWLMSAALMSSLVRRDEQIRKSERMTEAADSAQADVRQRKRQRRREFLRLEKVSEGKKGYGELAREQNPRQTRVPVVDNNGACQTSG